MDVLFFLLISSMMISSGEGDSFTMETKQCSVFPGRKPKCFIPIKEFGRSGQKEIRGYDRANTDEFINKGVSVAISGVKIKGTTGERVAFSTATVSCTKDTDYNDIEHGTQFWKSNGLDWKDVENLDAKDLVITTRREKWSCREGGTGRVKLYRMVSEHLTKKIVGKVRFPDGTFIHRIPIPRSQHDEKQMYRAVIREIKYTDSSFEKKIYDGTFKDSDNLEMAQENTGDFIELVKNRGIVTVSKRAPDSSGKIIYKRNPLIDTEEAFKDRQSKATCYRLDMDHFEKNLLFDIFPEWSYSVNGGGTYTPINPSNFNEKFIITMYQIIVCKIESQQEPNVFFRVGIEYLSTEDVNEVHVTDTIDNIYKFKLPGSSTETSFGIVENFDYNPEKTKGVFRFAGTTKIDESYTLWDDGELHMKEVPVERKEVPVEEGQSNKNKPSTLLKGFKKFLNCFSWSNKPAR